MEIKRNDLFSTIVFAGDSITDAGRDLEIKSGMNLGNGYVSLIDSYMKTGQDDEAPLILNAGISGNSSGQLYSRFKSDVDSFSPDCVIILIGINDAWCFEFSENKDEYSAEQYRINLQNIFKDYACSYQKVLLITPFYIEEHENSEKRKVYVDKYIKVLKEVAKTHKNSEILDMQTIFDDELANIGPANYPILSPDRVHLSLDGNILLKNAILKALGYE